MKYVADGETRSWCRSSPAPWEPAQPRLRPRSKTCARSWPSNATASHRYAKLDSLQALPVLNRQIIACRRCPRLVEYRERVGRVKRRAYQDWDYWARPVPGFGDPKARLLLLGW